MEAMDIFNDDAFSLVSMVAAVNDIDNIPGRAGELAFAGVAEGVPTTTVMIERKGEELSIIPTSPRGGPAPQEKDDKAELFPMTIPQVKMESTIGASQVQGVREFGSTNVLKSVQSVVNGRMTKITRKMDLTLENFRLGALKGIIRDADGSVLRNLYTDFGVSVPADFDFNLTDYSSDTAFEDAVRIKCHQVTRYMKRNAKMTIPASARIWSFVGDNFMDKLVENPSVKAVGNGWQRAEQLLGENYANGVFYFAGVFFENYSGTDDVTGEEASDGELAANGSVGIATDEARFFLTGVPGLYEEYYAPADFMDTVNTIGLPRYARIAQDTEFQRWVKLHVQQNPLPICLRPRTLVRGVA
jgi:hypothetical protein